jgi:imidazoleglycerol-phosphate dehydratase
MKIAFLIFPEIKLLDLLLAAEPLQQLQKLGLNPRNLQVDYVSEATLPSRLSERLIEVSLVLRERDASLSVVSLLLPISSGSPSDSATFCLASIPAANSHSLRLRKKVSARLAQESKTASRCMELIHVFKAAVCLPANTTTSYSVREVEIFVLIKDASRAASRADGSGKHKISTGIPFFDHMLSQIAVHGLFDLIIQAKGDLEIDPHHTVEDVGLALGKAFDQALGDRKGLVRMATASVPMDESLAQVSLDFSGRPYTVVEATWNDIKIGDLPVTLITHFLESFAVQARCNLSVRLITGGDDHHRAEAIFKAFARALDAATQLDPRRLGAVPSSKGVL